MNASTGLTEQGVLPLALCHQLCDALSTAASPDEALRHLNAARQTMLGAGLMTVNLDVTSPHDRPGETALLRWWTSDPEAYPVSGRKRKAVTPWTRQLLHRAEVFVGEGDAALAAVFDDHARIAALGLHAVVNVPLIEDGRCVATFNVLGTRPHWLPQELAAVRLLALLATPWVLRARRVQKRPDRVAADPLQERICGDVP